MCFHLMSIFSPIGRDLAVVYSPLIPFHFRNLLLDRSFYLVEVPDDEFDSMGCNVLHFSPCVMIVEVIRKQWNYWLKPDASSTNMQAGTSAPQRWRRPTCLTRPMKKIYVRWGFNWVIFKWFPHSLKICDRSPFEGRIDELVSSLPLFPALTGLFELHLPSLGFNIV